MRLIVIIEVVISTLQLKTKSLLSRPWVRCSLHRDRRFPCPWAQVAANDAAEVVRRPLSTVQKKSKLMEPYVHRSLDRAEFHRPNLQTEIGLDVEQIHESQTDTIEKEYYLRRSLYMHICGCDWKIWRSINDKCIRIAVMNLTPSAGSYILNIYTWANDSGEQYKSKSKRVRRKNSRRFSSCRDTNKFVEISPARWYSVERYLPPPYRAHIRLGTCSSSWNLAAQTRLNNQSFKKSIESVQKMKKAPSQKQPMNGQRIHLHQALGLPKARE